MQSTRTMLAAFTRRVGDAPREMQTERQKGSAEERPSPRTTTGCVSHTGNVVVLPLACTSSLSGGENFKFQFWGAILNNTSLSLGSRGKDAAFDYEQRAS